MGTPSDAPAYRGALVFLVVMVAAFLVVAGIFGVQAPERVPSHFNADGDADAWSSKTAVLAVLVPIGAGLPVLMGIAWPWGNWPAVLNMPHRDAWISSGRRQGLTDRVVVFMRLVAGLLSALMGVILLMMLIDAQAGVGGQTVPGWAFLAVTGLFLVGVALCVVKAFRDLRPDW